MNDHKRDSIISFLKQLRDQIVQQFESLESAQHFQRTQWTHHTGGGGEISLLRGKVFEKAAVNWSGVHGEQFPTGEAVGPFFATGISIITHMANPHAPTVHFNIRYIETLKKCWFGGGYDLTPMGFPYEEDTQHFHITAKTCLAPFGTCLYEELSENARKYFFIPHRNKERGVGGIFFDHWNSGDSKQDLSMWQAIGNSFLPAVMPIYKRRVNQPYQEEQKKVQQKFRAHYVEFNLLYDRGTKFGFLSGGNPDAILCSMPPNAAW